jgi:hypothetical protein
MNGCSLVAGTSVALRRLKANLLCGRGGRFVETVTEPTNDL